MDKEEVFKPKDGDIIVVNSITGRMILIFKQMSENGKYCYYYAACWHGLDSPFESGVNYKGKAMFIDARPATEKERGFLQRRLHMDGIGYNGYHKLIKLTLTPDVGQEYYYVDSTLCVCKDTWGIGGSEQQYRLKAGNCFLNESDAFDMRNEIQSIVRRMRKEREMNDKRDKLI